MRKKKNRKNRKEKNEDGVVGKIGLVAGRVPGTARQIMSRYGREEGLRREVCSCGCVRKERCFLKFKLHEGL